MESRASSPNQPATKAQITRNTPINRKNVLPMIDSLKRILTRSVEDIAAGKYFYVKAGRALGLPCRNEAARGAAPPARRRPFAGNTRRGPDGWVDGPGRASRHC